MLVQTRSVGVAFYARADQERWCRLLCSCGQGACWCRLLCSCRPGALVSPFMLVQTMSVGVAFYARADKEHWCRLLCSCGQGACWCCLLCSCRPGALVHVNKELSAMQFRLVQARSLVSYSLGSCGQGA
ncbi:hypothetical protein ACFX12_018913 [Malus domestica]